MRALAALGDCAAHHRRRAAPVSAGSVPPKMGTNATINPNETDVAAEGSPKIAGRANGPTIVVEAVGHSEPGAHWPWSL